MAPGRRERTADGEGAGREGAAAILGQSGLKNRTATVKIIAQHEIDDTGDGI